MSKSRLSYLFIPLLALIWGSSFILMKLGMFDASGKAIFSAAQVASLRIVLAGLVFLPMFPALFKKLHQKRDLLFFCIVGLGGNLIPAFLFTYAEQSLDSGIAGIMNSFTPVFTLIIGFLLFRNRIVLQQLIGTIIGFCGISWLLLAGQKTTGEAQLWPALAIVFATVLYGLSLNTIKHKLQHYKPLEVATGGFTMAFLPAFICFLFFETPDVITNHPKAMQGLLAVSTLGLIGTAFAVVLFNKIIAQTSALAASAVTYFIPIVAVLIGLSTGESLVWQQFVAMFVIIFAVLLINFAKTKATN
ncbi:MAG: DMT family transporter [Crocinitomicaceae bacterium]|jgi:drug/metabolite transporter (DMT)-like permease